MFLYFATMVFKISFFMFYNFKPENILLYFLLFMQFQKKNPPCIGRYTETTEIQV